MTKDVKEAPRLVAVLLAAAFVLTGCATTEGELAQKSSRSDLTSEKIALYQACKSEASSGHARASVNRRRLINNQTFQDHVRRLNMYCEVYAGLRPRTALKLEGGIDVTFAQSFQASCRAQAAGGRSLLFRPKPAHVERMQTLCDRMALDLGAES